MRLASGEMILPWWLLPLVVFVSIFILILLLGVREIAMQESNGPAPSVARQGVSATTPPYDRSAFGPAWADVDRNGCDTRNDILARDLINVVKDGSCRVLEGDLVDPYTGATQHFVRGRTTSSQVQIDHVYSLSEAWEDGAHAWTYEQRLAFANDPDNLVATNGSVNRLKSDLPPGEWLPPLDSARCPYVQTYALVGLDYGLPVQLPELLDDCHLTTL